MAASRHHHGVVTSDEGEQVAGWSLSAVRSIGVDNLGIGPDY